MVVVVVMVAVVWCGSGDGRRGVVVVYTAVCYNSSGFLLFFLLVQIRSLLSLRVLDPG